MKQVFEHFRATSLEVLPALKERYGLLLRRDLLSVQLQYKAGQVWVEYTMTDKDNYSFDNKTIVKRFSELTDNNGQAYFRTDVSIFENGRLLAEVLAPTELAKLADIFEDSARLTLINYSQA